MTHIVSQSVLPIELLMPSPIGTALHSHQLQWRRYHVDSPCSAIDCSAHMQQFTNLLPKRKQEEEYIEGDSTLL